MPGPDEAPRCSDWATSAGLNPQGTAFAAETVTLIGTPPPWPKPVFDHPLLAGLASSMETRLGTTRVLAFATQDRGQDELSVHVYSGRPMLGEIFVVPVGQLAGFVADPITGHHDARPIGPAPERLLAICTQGTHDVCCGTDGTRFANQADRLIAVARVSHTGGHRFAPTALQIPEGRMWSHLNMDVAAAIVERSVPPSELIDHCRGSIFMPPGPEQVAECAAFSAAGWDWTATEVHTIEPDRYSVTGTVADQTVAYDVELQVSREVPTISCRQPGGLPVKTRFEYEVLSITPSIGQ